MIAIAAEMVADKQIHPRVSFDINPTSRQILETLVDSKLLQKLIRAGGRIHQAGCNGCIGMGQAPATHKDEDWSGAGMSDEYDAAGKLRRGLFRPAMPLYDVEVQIPRSYWGYDLEKRMYALDQHFGDAGQSFQPRPQAFPKLNLKPDALARRGVF